MLAGGHRDTVRAVAVVDRKGLGSTAIAASMITNTTPVDRHCTAIGDKGGPAAGHQREAFDLLAVDSEKSILCPVGSGMVPMMKRPKEGPS